MEIEVIPPFAAGRTAELYPWQDGLALKLFRPEWGEADVEYEAYKARVVHGAGLPVPRVSGTVQVDGRFGILYERVSGIPLTQIIQTKPWRLLAASRWMADLHQQIHNCHTLELPALKDRLTSRIQNNGALPEGWRLVFLEMLQSLPEGQAICHGDFHPENIVLTPKGPVILDWMDATRGQPLGDVARTIMLLEKAVLPPDLPGRRMIMLIRAIFTRSYRRRYFAGQSFDLDEWQSWQAVIAAARLAEGIPEEKDFLVAYLQSCLDNRSNAQVQ